MSYARIDWEQFNVVNQDRRKAFEDLCRMLFNELFFEGKGNFHSNTNNPGIEIEPVLSPVVQKRISFQSKYFDRSVGYSQIKDSAKKTIQYYGGKIDVVYLFSNLDINTTTATFVETRRILEEANIEIVVMSNDAILDKVFSIPRLSLAYFRKQRLDPALLKEMHEKTVSYVSDRYNPQFNIVTETEDSLNLFAHTISAVEKTNARKTNLLKRIKDYGWRFGQYKDLASRIYTFIQKIPDVSLSNLIDSLRWYDEVNCAFCNEFEELRVLVNKNTTQIQAFYELKEYEKISALRRKNSDLEYILSLIDDLRFNDIEERLLQQKILVVNGEAGIGKTHLFATTVSNMLSSGLPSMLVLGTTMLTSEPFSKQIADATKLGVSFDELIDLLEEIGERNNCVSVLFIDAINESNKTPKWDAFLLELDSKLKEYSHIKVSISVRRGYEAILFNDLVRERIANKELLQVFHTGFRNHTVESVKKFLNYYNIPFYPLDYIQYEMINPLFLKMFCTNYVPNEWNLSSLFERYILSAEKEIQDKLGIASGRLLRNFLQEFIEIMTPDGRNFISAEDVMQFKFWDIYGLTSQKLFFLQYAVQAGVLLVFPNKDQEYYSVSYNLLANYLTAKYIVERFSNKSDLINFVTNDFLLMDENGCVHNIYAQEALGFICGLYSEKNRDELQEIIDCITVYKEEVINDYIHTFTWRNPNCIQTEDFFACARKYKSASNAVFSTLIVNSMKTSHPLNAKSLHEVLFTCPLSKRDACWTTYINGLANEQDRIYQIVQLYESGGYFDQLPLETNRLCLTLFSWLLTSSNRELRDHTSKAMIEIIKYDITLGQYLLEKFKDVNDSYVIERLYGIVFGAIVKRTNNSKSEYKKLCDYVYQTIFSADEVYPDILLRDYARLIIERYIYEFGECADFQKSKIIPPYNSQDLPVVPKESYRIEDAVYSGWNRVHHSMIPNCSDVPGIYGDFGRYTFESALNNFKGVDVSNAYHFAMQYIRDTLGYDDDLLGWYDSSGIVRFDRGYGGSIERIGKKYQWIALHYILARISDNYLYKNYSDKDRYYEGAWDLFVRDFDPTFNVRFASRLTMPTINWHINDKSKSFISKKSTKEVASNWTKNDCGFFEHHAKKLHLCSIDGFEWVALHVYDHINNEESDMFYEIDPSKIGGQKIWSISNSFFVKMEDWDQLRSKLEDIDFRNHSFPEANSDSIAFYGEYPWGPACFREEMPSWKDCVFKTGKSHIETYDVPIFLRNYGACFEKNVIEREVEEEATLCQILPAYTYLSWSAEEDYSKTDDMALHAPCAELIDYFKLSINDGSSAYLSAQGDVVCFDTKDANGSNVMLIRKEYLERFIEAKKYVLFWACFGEKQFFHKEQSWSEWSGFFYYDKGTTKGSFEIKSGHKNNSHNESE